MSEDDVRQMIREMGSSAKTARALGVSPAYVSHAITGTRKLGPKILRGLGLRKTVRYEKVIDNASVKGL